MKVLYEDNHLLVISKPAGVPTMGARAGIESVYDWARDDLKRRYQKPGNVFVGIVHRLDALATGVLVLARTSKAAARLGIQFGGPGKHKKISQPAEKLYLAMVEGQLHSDLAESGKLVDQVFKDDAAKRMRVAHHDNPAGGPGAQQARLQYCVVARSQDRTLIAVRLLTGRKHQIRLQWSDRGYPILGDRKYGAGTEFPSGIALHSWQLIITHPTRGVPMRLVAPVPDAWRRCFNEFPSPARIESLVADRLNWSTAVQVLPEEPSP